MASIYDKASLVLIPSGTKTSKVYSQVPTNGDGDFTFSRSTAATRVNASGNIEKETQNLLLQSNGFSTSPFTTSNTSVTGGQAGYDGTNNAWSLTSNGTNGFENLHQIISFSGVYTISVYAKQGSNDYLTIRTLGDDLRVQFKLDDGTHSTTFGSPIDTFMEDAGGGWYRCGFTANFSSATYVLFYPQIIGITTAGSIYIQDAQLEQGLVARNVITTTTTAIYGGITDNVPRLDYTDSSCPALLLEPQRTNVVENSEYHSGSTYGNNDVSTTDNEAISPEGVQNAAKIVLDSGTNISNGGHFLSFSSTGGTTYTISVFAKAGEYRYFTFTYGSSSAGGGHFDLQEGTLLGTITSAAYSNITASIEDYGNGWYRLVVSLRDNASVGARFMSMKPSPSASVPSNNNYSSTGDGTSGAYIYGFQLEEASYATSYIPTYGSAVTRAYENQDATGLSTSVFNNDDLTLFYDFDYNANGREGSTTAYRIFSGSSQLGIKGRSGSSRSVEIYSSGSFSGSIVFNNIANSSRIKVALRITNGTCELFFNGAKDTETIDVSGAAPYTWGQITMLASSSLNTSLNQCLGFPTALTDQELIDLTTL